MTPPFTPLAGRSRWEILYGVLVKHGVGDLIPYEELGGALDLDAVKDRHTIQLAMRRAGREYLRRDERALIAVPNEGYRVVRADEQVGLAQGRQRRARVQLARGQDLATYVDTSELSPEQRRVFEVMAVAFGMQMEVMRRLDVRQRRLEEALATMAARVETTEERTDDQVRDLRERLERLESRLQ